MIRSKYLWAILIALIAFKASKSQSFGGNPSSTRWQQINTDAVRVIFPKGMDSAAARIATITNALANRRISTIGDRTRKVTLVLQADNTLSNAYIQMAPYRGEFFLTTPQNALELGSLRWIENLSLHEYRHVEQYSNFNHGFTKAFSILFGQGGQALANALTVPDWFFEGDAVWNETVYSKQGRGRLPGFFNGYKSLLYGDKDYSFMKLRNGSFKDYTPSHYELGYLLVSYGREQFGDSLWRKVTTDAVDFKGFFYPLQKAVKRHTGVSYSTFVKDALHYYQADWNDQLKEKELSAVDWITDTAKNNVINYYYPYPAAENSIITVKRSYKQVPTFMRVKEDGNEEKIAIKSISEDDYFSYKNGKIVYAAWKPDIRWGNRDYTIIRLLDVYTKKETSFGVKGKYFSPDISSDGDRIIVVDADPHRSSTLKLFSKDGSLIKSWSADSSYFYSQPKFTTDDKQVVVAARKTNGAMGWLLWNIEDNQSEWILEPSNQIIALPVVIGDSLFYTGSAGKTDALYLINLQTKSKPVLIADYATGVYQGFYKGDKIIATTFTAGGQRIGKFEPLQISNTTHLLQDLYTPNTMERHENLLNIPTATYTSKKYSKAFQLINFHSWQPAISDPDYTFRLLGENVLSTLYSEVYYNYNRNENSNELGATAIYGGWYLQPYGSISQTWGREVQLSTDTVLVFNQSNIQAGMKLPLNLSFKNAYRFLTFSSSLNRESIRWTGFAKNKYENYNFNYLSARIDYTVQLQKARQNIYPRYAESFLIDAKKSLGKEEAWQVLLSGYWYLPGVLKTHNLVLSAAYQRRDTLQNYIYGNSFPFSRGYSDVNFPKMLRLGANYHFPILYPDWGFGQIVYFQRIRLNLFYDYTKGISARQNRSYFFNTAGTEMFFDSKWWNQLPVSFGVRYSRLLNNEFRGSTNPNRWEFILPVNLLPR